MATELAEDVWHFDLGMVNAYLLVDDSVVLVDAGAPWHRAAIREGLAAAGFEPRDLDHVVVTHFDLDHVGTLAKLDGLDATVHMPAPDAGYLTGESVPSIRSRKGLMQRGFTLFVSAPDLPIRCVEDGDRIGPLKAHRTPGHTPGHTAYVTETKNAAFLGDLVVEDDGELSVAPWYLNDDTDRSRESVRILSASLPPFDVAAMGHGDPLPEDGDDALSALASHHSRE